MLAQLVGSQTLSLSLLWVLFPGNTMTVSYMTGLMVGSTVAYAAYSFTAPGQEARLPTPMPVNSTGYWLLTWWKENTPTCYYTHAIPGASAVQPMGFGSRSSGRDYSLSGLKRGQKQHFHHLIIINRKKNQKKKKKSSAVNAFQHLVLHKSSQSEQRCWWCCHHGNQQQHTEAFVYKCVVIYQWASSLVPVFPWQQMQRNSFIHSFTLTTKWPPIEPCIYLYRRWSGVCEKRPEPPWQRWSSAVAANVSRPLTSSSMYLQSSNNPPNLLPNS